MSIYSQIIIANLIYGSLIYLEFFSLVNSYNGLVKKVCQNFFTWQGGYRARRKQALFHGLFWFLQGAVLIPVLIIFMVLPAIKFNKEFLAPGLILGIILGFKSVIKEIKKFEKEA
ncbi:MAG: hypothetical protein ISS87_02295 [Candidatus Pacebacteria bacterium]|nr:hypothetical protein [Candidatus Paceibacterota bacterium]